MIKLHQHITGCIFIALTAILFSCTENKAITAVSISENDFKIELPKDQIVTNNGIRVPFTTYDKKTYSLLDVVISGTYGTTVLKTQLKDEQLSVYIPKEITQHAGMIEWELMAQQKTLQKGTFQLLPNLKKLHAIENYAGPRSIIANDRDYTMLVSIPVDHLDNLLPDQTPLKVSYQFKGTISNSNKQIESGFAWQRIPAPQSTGRLITGSTMESISSKELVIDVFPDIPVAFNITKDSNHNYADGNELITLKTDQIKDPYGNVLTDGTLVTFYIHDDLGNTWNTTASTVNGYAFAKALHPQSPSTWTVKGVITGMVESPELDIKFQSIIDQIPVSIDQNNTITIGPLTSYLGQIIPDGIPVTLKFKDQEITVRTKNGMARHIFDQQFNESGNYEVMITTLGTSIVKRIELR